MYMFVCMSGSKRTSIGKLEAHQERQWHPKEAWHVGENVCFCLGFFFGGGRSLSSSYSEKKALTQTALPILLPLQCE